MSFPSLKRQWSRLSALELPVYAANASFFILLSVFPGMMLLIGLLQYTPLSPDDLQRALAELLPAPLLPLLDYMTQELFAGSSVALASLSAMLALRSASNGAYSLLRGLNRVHQVRETRGYLRVRLRCAVFTVLLLAALLLTVALQLFGQRLGCALEGAVDPFLCLLAALLRMKYWLMTVLLTAFFSLVYAVLPNHRTKPRRLLPGAFAAAVGWQVFSAVFSYYVNRFGNWSLYYGSLSAIALTMLWLYVCMIILFLGAVLNRWGLPFLARRTRSRVENPVSEGKKEGLDKA